MSKRFFQPVSAAASALAFLFLIGCSSTPQVNPQLEAAIAAKNVNPATLQKINNGWALNYSDVMNLVQSGVETQVIVNYLQSTQTPYKFTYSQLQSLRGAGASNQLLNYLTETEGFYGHSTAAQQTAWQSRQVPAPEEDNTQLYQDEAPFAYNPPIIDDWYDSGYEESLYSPFSMN